MNYIQQLKAYYELLQGNPMTSSEQLLYHTLLMVNNACGWLEWFQRTNQSLCGLVGIDEKTLIGARNRLKQKDLIDFIAAKKKGEVTKYKIIPLYHDKEQKTDYIMDGIIPPIAPSNAPPITPPITPPNPPDIYKLNNIKQNINIPFKEIIEYLNRKAGTDYRLSTKKTNDCITARWNEGFRLDDFKKVIDKKCLQWIGTVQEEYLRPETLFGNKFDGYLNQKISSGKAPDTDKAPNAQAYKEQKDKCPLCNDTGWIIEDGHEKRCKCMEV